MSVIKLALDRIIAFPETLIYSAYSLGGWLLFRILGPEECEPAPSANRRLGVLQANLNEPIPDIKLAQR